jgi:hypothetical protein|tara:strand:- start:2142 stop:2360 length:219 start_codon:yes stop_codon:yes gene_type:complete
MPINKKANENLPQDLQDTINTFIEQANIVEEYDLDTMPMEYFVNLIEKLKEYHEYPLIMDLLKSVEEGMIKK